MDSTERAADLFRAILADVVREVIGDMTNAPTAPRAPIKADLSTSPADRPRRPKYSKRKPRRIPTFYRKTEFDLLMQTAERRIIHAGRGVNSRGHRVCNIHPYRYAQQDKLILVLGGHLGLRVAEATGLKVEHVNLQERDVFVRGKCGHERMIPIPKKLYDYLAWWCRFRETGYLLRSMKGGRLHEGTVNCRLKRLGRLAKLDKRMHSHALRHTFCTRILEEGGDIVDIRDLAGHSSLQSTQIYLHCAPEKRRSAIDRL